MTVATGGVGAYLENMALNPRTQHMIEQFMALNLEVQTALRGHHRMLVSAGWSNTEAWALCQLVEVRILGPAMDFTSAALKLEDSIEERVAEAVAEEVRRTRGP